MPSLRKLQRGFAAGVFNPSVSDFTQHIHPGRFPAERHFQVYRNNVFESLTGALRAVYPVVERLVGDGFFRYAADIYIREHPPTSGNLHDFGASFAEFLTDFPPARELVYLSDVAHLEWAWHQSFHAADGAPLALAVLASISPEQYADLKFTLQPSARLVSSAYPMLRIWEVNQPAHQGDQTVDLGVGGVKLLVIRRGQIEIEPLGEGDYALLSAFAAGVPCAQAAEAALHAQTDYDLATALRHHVASTVLAGFSC
jgi:hypothetical protein